MLKFPNTKTDVLLLDVEFYALTTVVYIFLELHLNAQRLAARRSTDT